MIISITYEINALGCSFSGIHCVIRDLESIYVYRKAIKFGLNVNGEVVKCRSVLEVDTASGTSSFYLDSSEVFPLYRVRTQKLFEKPCDLSRFINLFATKKAQIIFKS